MCEVRENICRVMASVMKVESSGDISVVIRNIRIYIEDRGFNVDDIEENVDDLSTLFIIVLVAKNDIPADIRNIIYHFRRILAANQNEELNNAIHEITQAFTTNEDEEEDEEEGDNDDEIDGGFFGVLEGYEENATTRPNEDNQDYFSFISSSTVRPHYTNRDYSNSSGGSTTRSTSNGASTSVVVQSPANITPVEPHGEMHPVSLNASDAYDDSGWFLGGCSLSSHGSGY